MTSNLPFNPVLALESTDGVLFDQGTGAVSEWIDQSTQGNHLRSLVLAERPTIGAVTTPSGLDAIRFDGVDDRLLRDLNDPGGITGLPNNRNDRTVFLVAQFHSASGSGGAAYGRGSINQAFGVGVAADGSGQGGGLIVQGWGAGNDLILSEKGYDSPGNTNGWVMITVVQQNDGSAPTDNVFVYLGGTQIASWDHKFNTKNDVTVDFNGNTASRIVLGEEIKELGHIELDVAAYVVYDAVLTSGDRLSVEDYLFQKYLSGSSNQPPIASNDSVTIGDGATTLIDILANDSDPDGSLDPTSVAIVTPATQASSFTVNPTTGVVSYTHNGSGTPDSFTYTVRDNEGVISNIATVTINLTTGNQSPVAVDDDVTIDPGATTVIDVLANDFDSDGSIDSRRVSVVDFPAHATAFSLNLLTGAITYTHDGSASGDVFTYTVLDNVGAISNTATVTINLTAANQSPTATNDSVTINDGATTAINILSNDSDPDGSIDPTSVAIVTAAGQAAFFEVNPTTGVVSYTHNGLGSPDSFSYTVLDNEGAISNTATVTISLSSSNQIPVANGDAVTIPNGAVRVINVLSNDMDPDGSIDPTSVVIIDPPSQAASIAVNALTGAITYTHNGSGTADSFTYTVEDNLGQVSNVATVTVSIGQPLSLSGFGDQLVAPVGLNQPISLAFLPDGRMLILEKGGVIWIADPNSGVRQVYMTLTNIDAGGEKGLLDITLAPDFDPDSPGDDYFYIYYTPASPQRARLARFTHLENDGGLTSAGDLSSEYQVWEDTDGYISCCHYGGGLDFGPDGKLWLTVSDKFTAPNPGEGGTNQNHPQNLTKAGGKVIRVNPDGSIPDGTDGWPANPFIDSVDDDPNVQGNQNYLDSIWAYGLRNPFRARWDVESGRFFIAEVGGNVQSIAHEDIHVAMLTGAGANFGWPYFEGTPPVQVLNPNGVYAPTHGFTPIVPDLPIFSYAHAGAGASITGGEVYRGDQFPTAWDGVYFYGDFTRDFIRYLTFDATGGVSGDFALMPTGAINRSATQVVNITVGPDGALYYVLIGGTIRRVYHNNRNDAPVILSATPSVSAGDAPLSVNFSAQVSDPEGSPMTFTWHFGDGSTVSGSVVGGVASASYNFTADGLYKAFVEISDGANNVISAFVPIQVGDVNAPPVISQFDVSSQSGPPPLDVTFTAQVNDVDDDPLTYEIIYGNGQSSGSIPVPVGGQITHNYSYATEGVFGAILVISDGIDVVQTSAKFITVGTSHLPPVTDGLVLLLQSDIKVAISSGSTVAAWLDGSGFGNNLDAFGNPQFVANATPGGLPAIVFDGVGDKLERLSSATFNGIPMNADDRTMFIVVRYIDPQAADAGVAFGKGSHNRAFGLVADHTDGTLMVQGWNAANNLDSTAAGREAGWLTQSVVVSSNLVTHYKDGIPIGSFSHVYQTRLDAPNSKIVIGESIDGLGASYFEIGAVLLYDKALSEGERQQIEDYLHTKYFVGNLPPSAADDSAVVENGDAVVIDVLGNDFDLDGVLNPASVTVLTAPMHGGYFINTLTGEITYTHDGSATTIDTFTYTVDDEVGATSGIATVTISINKGIGSGGSGGVRKDLTTVDLTAVPFGGRVGIAASRADSLAPTGAPSMRSSWTNGATASATESRFSFGGRQIESTSSTTANVPNDSNVSLVPQTRPHSRAAAARDLALSPIGVWNVRRPKPIAEGDQINPWRIDAKRPLLANDSYVGVRRLAVDTVFEREMIDGSRPYSPFGKREIAIERPAD